MEFWNRNKYVTLINLICGAGWLIAVDMVWFQASSIWLCYSFDSDHCLSNQVYNMNFNSRWRRDVQRSCARRVPLPELASSRRAVKKWSIERLRLWARFCDAPHRCRLRLHNAFTCVGRSLTLLGVEEGGSALAELRGSAVGGRVHRGRLEVPDQQEARPDTQKEDPAARPPHREWRVADVSRAQSQSEGSSKN